MAFAPSFHASITLGRERAAKYVTRSLYMHVVVFRCKYIVTTDDSSRMLIFVLVGCTLFELLPTEALYKSQLNAICFA